jgi:hypothetical protein
LAATWILQLPLNKCGRIAIAPAAADAASEERQCACQHQHLPSPVRTAAGSSGHWVGGGHATVSGCPNGEIGCGTSEWANFPNGT